MRPLTLPTLLLSALLFLAAALALVAAPAETAPAGTNPLTSWSAMWITVLVPVVIAGLKSVWPSVPKACLPFLCPVLGALCGWVGNQAGLQTDPGAAVMMGTLGNFLRECYDQSVKVFSAPNLGRISGGMQSAVAAVLVAFAFSPASVQAAQPDWLGAAPETRFSVSPFASYRAHEIGQFNGKWGGGLAAAVHLNRWIALETETIAERLDDSVWTGSLTEFGANFKTSLLPTKVVNPYLLIGYTRNLDQCDNRMNAGAGLEFRLGKHGAIFADGRWTHNFEVLGHALFRTGISVRF